MLQALTRVSNVFAISVSNSDDIVGKIMQATRKYDCMDAGGRATQELKPRTPKVGALGDAGADVEDTEATERNNESGHFDIKLNDLLTSVFSVPFVVKSF